jgi:hypothetical protein
MQIQTKSISLADGRSILVCEADGNFDPRLAQMEANAKKLESDDKTLIYFAMYFYPVLYACTKGEAPSLEDAYAMAPADLDGWYQTVAELNPEIIKLKDPAESRICAFRDDTQLTVHRTNDLPSYMLKLFKYEQTAQDNPPTVADEIPFRIMIYPKLAACSSGEIPSVDDAIKYPRTELSKWMDLAVELNRDWFLSIIDAAAEVNKKELVKKKGRGRAPSRKNGAVLQKIK